MKCQFPSQNGLQDTCVLRQGRVWPSTADNFVQIIHISPGHWACLSNKFSSAGQVDLYDSLHTRPEEDGTIVPQACLILHSSEPQITIRVVNVGLQQGTNDCGLFSIAMAYDLCCEVDPSTKLYMQDRMRSHLHSCFNNKQMKPFPSCNTNTAMTVIYNLTVKVYCICRMSEGSEFMVRCDSCSEWYHGDCVTVPQEIRENESNEVVWQCPRCQPGTGIMIWYVVTSIVSCTYVSTQALTPLLKPMPLLLPERKLWLLRKPRRKDASLTLETVTVVTKGLQRVKQIPRSISERSQLKPNLVMVSSTEIM